MCTLQMLVCSGNLLDLSAWLGRVGSMEWGLAVLVRKGLCIQRGFVMTRLGCVHTWRQDKCVLLIGSDGSTKT